MLKLHDVFKQDGVEYAVVGFDADNRPVSDSSAEAVKAAKKAARKTET